MHDQPKTLAAISIIVGFLLLIMLVIIAIISGTKVVSPIPEQSTIRIIFVTPTPVLHTSSPSANLETTPSR